MSPAKVSYGLLFFSLQTMRGVFAGRLMTVLESSKHLNKFIWGIQAQNITLEENSEEKIFILNMKVRLAL